ncbi:MAG: ATP-grasp domain-containing protein [Desulfuromonadales bacterium]|nr:ATP-grasp domain-containing protein [Desulfuromonadales bacterium]
MNVLITDGENRSALAVTRSLGRKGCRVVVTGKEARSLASSSKFCQQGLPVPDPLLDGADYVKAIGEIVAREAIDVIFPMTEQSIHLLNQDRGRLPGRAVLASPPAAKMQAVADKVSLFQLAEKLGVPVPRTLYLTGPEDLAARVCEIDRYPVVVKPTLSSIPEVQGFISGGVRYAKSQGELERLYGTQKALRYPSMIQEKIEGPGTGLFSLYDNDRHLALFSHRRLREKPPSGGVSVVSESVPLDEEMVDAADRLLSVVEWSGVAMVEFKRDLRDGQAKLMEINGRFWGTLQLAIACGVDFPGLLLDHLQGNTPPSPIRDYRVGYKLKWFFGTLDHLLIRLKYSGEKLNLPSSSPSRQQSIIDFLKVREKNTSFDVFERNDPGPFWFEGRSYICEAMRVG